MPTDMIVTAPLPPFLYEPLKADYRCHDYAQAADKAGLLAALGAAIRGLVQGGGTVTPTTLLDALPAGLPGPSQAPDLAVQPIPLAGLDSAALEKLSVQGGLALDGAEMTAIQQHFQKLGRAPTRMELETLAQTKCNW